MTYKELITLLRTSENVEDIDCVREEIAALIPAVRTMFDFKQKNSAHQYDLWHHSVHTVLNLPRSMDDDMIYLAALLHDIGKPDCQIAGKRIDDVNMHYYGHPARSLEIVKDEVIPILQNQDVGLSEEAVRELLYYVEYHDDRVSLRRKHLRRHLAMVSLQQFQHLMMLEVADAKAHIQLPVIAERVRVCEKLAGGYAVELLHEIEQET